MFSPGFCSISDFCASFIFSARTAPSTKVTSAGDFRFCGAWSCCEPRPAVARFSIKTIWAKQFTLRTALPHPFFAASVQLGFLLGWQEAIVYFFLSFWVAIWRLEFLEFLKNKQNRTEIIATTAPRWAPQMYGPIKAMDVTVILMIPCYHYLIHIAYWKMEEPPS